MGAQLLLMLSVSFLYPKVSMGTRKVFAPGMTGRQYKNSSNAHTISPK